MEEHDSSVSSAIKITLPENVMGELNEYCESLSQTKSDVIKSAIKYYIRNDELWQERLFFFRNRREFEGQDLHEMLEDLQNARKGWVVKVAISTEDDPTTAEALNCDLIKVDGEYVHIKPSAFQTSSVLSDNVQDIKLKSGSLSVPYKVSERRKFARPEYTYKIHYSLIWEIDQKTR